MKSLHVADKKIHRIYRNSKILYTFAKFGSKGLSKVNPTLFFVDAAVSVGELYLSCLNYKTALEKNKQIKEQIKVLKNEYENLQKIMKEEEKVTSKILEYNFTIFEKKLIYGRETIVLKRKIYDFSFAYLHTLKDEIENFGKLYPYAQETKALKNRYIQAMDAYLDIAENFIGG